MTILQAIVLGFIQGLTEFLPISSSAHLRIAGDLLGWGDPGAAFTAIVQIGTELAVLVYFAKDIWRIIKAWFSSMPWVKTNRLDMSNADVRMGWIVIAATFPIAILGVLFQDVIETNLRNLYIVATVLALFALALGAADRCGAQEKRLEEMTLKDGIIIGFGQALALIPGVSRSGGTITTGLILGYTREAAARASFLLAVPAVLAAGFFELFKTVGSGTIDVVPTAVGTLTAFVVGYAVIVWFLKLVSTRSYAPFVIYRIFLASAIFGLLGTGVLSPLG